MSEAVPACPSGYHAPVDDDCRCAVDRPVGTGAPHPSDSRSSADRRSVFAGTCRYSARANRCEMPLRLARNRRISMRAARIFALAWMAAASACVAATFANAEEYEGFASLDDASMPLSLQLSGGGFSTTIYEDKGKACPGENAPFSALRQAVLGAATGWMRVSYKDCKENFALFCVDTDLTAKGPLPICTAITTAAPPAPDIIESFAGTVAFGTDDDPNEPSISFSERSSPSR